ncbi:uncharacterized protein LOC105175435 isoform X2 [Sesamum indicum]|uniref:Uncharacterized protein LOC105175435 isoform X2 n=1 Tax=Sesamum indicum TaxID=4182 RepID=A0A8M8VCU2_SESIN|nr:uncharacterized protein LOC105175435 isoform X2 [Sesamum indicum]
MRNGMPASIWAFAVSCTRRLLAPSPDFFFSYDDQLLIVASGSPVTRWASVAFGAGVGIGSAYSECSHKFNGSPPKLTPNIFGTPPSKAGDE